MVLGVVCAGGGGVGWGAACVCVSVGILVSKCLCVGPLEEILQVHIISLVIVCF